MKDIYFEKIGLYENLYIEKILFEFELEPIIFVCTDGKEKFLCNCIDFRDGYEWILSKTNNTVLIDLINKKLDLRDAFTSKSNETYYIVYDEVNDCMLTNKIDVTNFDKSYFVSEGTKLQINATDKHDYLSFLNGTQYEQVTIDYKLNSIDYHKVSCKSISLNSMNYEKNMKLDIDIFNTLLDTYINNITISNDTILKNLFKIKLEQYEHINTLINTYNICTSHAKKTNKTKSKNKNIEDQKNCKANRLALAS